jgi:hypothetical protein
LPKCQFTTEYYDYEIDDEIHFCCPEEPLPSGFCIFHDKDYLQDKTNYEDHKRKVLERLKHKVNHAISNKETLLCIGFQLPDLSLSDLSVSKEFTIPVYFSSSQFFGKAYFHEANFQDLADFSLANFQVFAYFHDANFQGEAYFHDANFKTGEADFYGCGFYDRTYFSGHFNGETKSIMYYLREKRKLSLR